MLTEDKDEIGIYLLKSDIHEKGIYPSFEKAIDEWEDGYTIYDSNGIAIYPKKQEILMVLKKGDKGSKVKALQLLLIGYGYELSPFGADGNFNQTVEDKVKEFQESNDIEANGIVTKETWKILLGG